MEGFIHVMYGFYYGKFNTHKVSIQGEKFNGVKLYHTINQIVTNLQISDFGATYQKV